MTPATAQVAQPPRPPAGRCVVVATDLDRTFTRLDLTLSMQAIRRAQALRRQGIRIVLATGRRVPELPLDSLRGVFDALVVEGGAVWGRPQHWTHAAPAPAFWQAADAVADAGFEVRRGLASFSVPTEAGPALEPCRGGLNLHPNRDRIDVTLPGVDKATGVQQAVESLAIRDPWILAIGDAENDAPLLRAASAGVAVANATPALMRLASHPAPAPGHLGFLWAVTHLAEANT